MIRRAQPWLGTLVEISIVDLMQEDTAKNMSNTAAAINAAFAAVAMVHRRMSFHAADSDVAAINRLPVGDSIAVDAHTATVLRCAMLIEQASAGAFNIACGSTLAAWGHLPGPVVPAGFAAPLATPLPRGAITVTGEQVTKNDPAWIDLGGIAKGYAVDLAVDVLVAAGIAAGCVNAGGDLRVFGAVDFPVAIRNPQAPTRIGQTLQLREQALATSACYFSRRVDTGVVTSALVDGSNGSPVTNERSASVRAPTCMLADALTKLVIAGGASHPLLARFSATAFLI